jgi:hypothetical protein
MSKFVKLASAGALSLTLACGAPPEQAPLATSADATRDHDDDGRDERDGRRDVLDFGALTGAPRPYAGTGATNAIRGVPAGGLPWVVGRARARLRWDSTLQVKVEGLVFDPTDADVVAAGRAGRNTVAQFRAIVSCQTVQDGAATVVNVSTAPVPATIGLATEGGGNARIEERLALPSPCIAPIVFVTSPTGAWFAASGF